MFHKKHRLVAPFYMALAFLISGISVTRAAEPLVFQSHAPVYRQEILQNFIASLPALAEGASVATTDLNRDGLSEFILKNTQCHGGAHCDYYIAAALPDGSMTVIGTMAAKNIALSDNYTNGIRDILVYNQETNAYKPATYIWNAAISRYQEQRDIPHSKGEKTK